ncbi:RTA1 like protein-domain-containing protein [Bisporella sp. PMI_857]|nr:RTA1 like protein-domain-containing protein [Bisporella sp. PMI_857]
MIPDKNGYVPEYACNANYTYYPSFAAAVVFAVFFGITTFTHIFQALYYKKLRLCWPLIMGALWEFASFSIRAPATRNQQEDGYVYPSVILMLLAPMWINAFVYMVMGRMIYFYIPDQKVWAFKGIKIAKIFVWLDVISFLVQVGGGSMIQPDSSVLMVGIRVYMGGIGFQELCILLFLSVAVKFHLTMLKQERDRVLLDQPRKWRALLYTLYLTLALITVRIIFRLVEYSSGLEPEKNPIPFHEAYFLVLDCLMMLIACIALNFVHPGRFLVGQWSEFPKGPTRKEKKAAKAAKKEANKQAKEEKRMIKEESKMQKKLEIPLVQFGVERNQ